MTEIVIATGNPHKVQELRAILGDLSVGVVGLGELEARGEGPFVEPEETGDTFEENATIKALSYARQTGRVCLADDSGLEIDALDGRPGVISSHYCTDGVEEGMSRDERDRLNCERVMREMEGVEERGARFVCVMVLGGLGGATRPRGGGILPPGSTGFQPVAEGSRCESSSEAQPGAPLSPASGKTFDGRFMTSRRVLPHWQAGRATYFVTFRLNRGELSDVERQIVLDAMLHFDGDRYVLHGATVMADHAHMLFRLLPLSENEFPTLASIMHSIKSFTSNKIQRERGKRGVLWQREYFDRIMRGQGETQEKLRYIAENPVRRGLCEKPGDYPFTYLYQRECGDSGGFCDRLEAGATGGMGDCDRLEAGATGGMGDCDRLEAGATGGRDARHPGSLGDGASLRDRIGVLAVARGEFAGRIGLAGEVPRGADGFGYDPLFLVGPEFARTSAEMGRDEKNAVSHRAKACGGMAVCIKALLRETPRASK